MFSYPGGNDGRQENETEGEERRSSGRPSGPARQASCPPQSQTRSASWSSPHQTQGTCGAPQGPPRSTACSPRQAQSEARGAQGSPPGSASSSREEGGGGSDGRRNGHGWRRLVALEDSNSVPFVDALANGTELFGRDYSSKPGLRRIIGRAGRSPAASTLSFTSSSHTCPAPARDSPTSTFAASAGTSAPTWTKCHSWLP